MRGKFAMQVQWSRFARDLTFAAALYCCAGMAHAQDFKLALSAPPNSMDPHWHNLFSNINVSEHIFESLIKLDADSRAIPGLAASWRLVDPTTWEFTLRDARFHDGSALTVEDVFYSIDRPATIVGSPGPFTLYTKAIIGKQKVSDKVFRFKTAAPCPLMLNDLTTIFIVKKSAVEGASQEDMSTGLKGMVGTGPYRFAKYVRDDRVELARNPLYWGNRAPYQSVTLRFIANNAARVAALLSNDVQAIDNVPTPDLERIRNDRQLAFFSKVSHRVIYLSLDFRETSPFITAKDGSPLKSNPLRDARVRKAFNLAINRQAIADRVMQGLAQPTFNLVPSTLFGYHPQLTVPKADPEAARKLLTDAGYPDGFAITLHSPNNRYVNDEQIAQAIAAMLVRIGIAVRVETMPLSVYFPRANRKEFSLGLTGWGAQTGEVSSPLRAILLTRDDGKGWGTVNNGSYSNAQFDALLVQALAEVDDSRRENLLQQATRVALDDYAILPIHHQVTTWAARRGVVYEPRTDERTYAFSFKPAPISPPAAQAR